MRRTTRSCVPAGFAVVLVLAACESPSEPPLDPASGIQPSMAISDAQHDGTQGFYFLPPMVKKNPRHFSGEFDKSLSPVVRICQWVANACVGDDIVIDDEGKGSERIKRKGNYYGAHWKDTDDLEVGETYRLRVYKDESATTPLGFADLLVVAKNKDRKDVPDAFIGIVRKKHLDIRFRIEEGATANPDPNEPDPDEAPLVSSSSPVNGATDVARNANINITFNEAVVVTGDWFEIVCTTTGTRTPDDADVSGGPLTFAIDPDVDFVVGETCEVTIVAAQVADQDADDPPGNMEANHVFDFTILVPDAAPSVFSTSPANDAGGVARSANISIGFSEAVNVTGAWFAIECTTTAPRTPADTDVSGGPVTFTIDPDVDFAPGETCEVTVVAAQVADQDADDPPENMAADHKFEFTTVPDVAPSVSSTSPADNATAVAANANISITFSEAVNVTGEWFEIDCTKGGKITPDDASVSGGPLTFTIDPDADLPRGETCKMTIVAEQVSDQDGDDPPDEMAADHDFEFAIVPDPAPSVTSTSPADNATGVARGANISIAFSEAVSVTGNWFEIECSITGTRTANDADVTGGPLTFTIDPDNNFALGETCEVTVVADRVGDDDGNDPPNNMAADHVFDFTVVATQAPSAVADGPATGSIPGDPFHSFVEVASAINAPGLLANDDLGVPAGTITSFGGGDLGGTVTSNVAGTTVPVGTLGEVTVTANGGLAFRPPNGFTGAPFTFQYRVTNSAGSSDATVTIWVGPR